MPKMQEELVSYSKCSEARGESMEQGGSYDPVDHFNSAPRLLCRSEFGVRFGRKEEEQPGAVVGVGGDDGLGCGGAVRLDPGSTAGRDASWIPTWVFWTSDWAAVAPLTEPGIGESCRRCGGRGAVARLLQGWWRAYVWMSRRMLAAWWGPQKGC